MVEIKDSRSQVPGQDYFEGERLELLWRFVYRPEFIPLLKEYVGMKSGMNVLDLGCGTGFLSRILAKNVSDLQVVGVDFDKKLLDIGREMIAREGLGDQIELRQGDAYKLPFPDETFDMTISQTLLWILGNPTQGLREKIRVTKRGGIVSAIACFCHSGNLPHYHGRYLPKNNHRIDELKLKLDRVFRINIRPMVLGVDHSIPSLDVLWQFKDAGLVDIQINGHLALVSPGDSRIPEEEGAAYAIMRHQIEFDNLLKMREKHSEQLENDGFSRVEFDELIDLKRNRLAYIKENPTRVKEMMEVFTQPLIIIKSNRP